MQFRLPENLSKELLAYDPELKALARQQNQTTKPSKKSKYPLGNVPHLIPYNVIRESIQQDAIDNINTQTAPNRLQRFTVPVDVATPQARLVTKAILYHYEQCWYAAWLPPKGEDYVYGYSYALKDTATARKVIPFDIRNNLDEYEQVHVGRTTFLVYHKLVTKQDIINGKTQACWRADGAHSYYNKSVNIAPAITSFSDALKETIPQWEDGRTCFDRLVCQEIWQALDIPKELIPEDKRTGWQLTVDNLFEICKQVETTYGTNSYREIDLQYVNRMHHVLSKPFFRKWIQKELQSCVDEFNNPDCKFRQNVRRGLKRILKLAENMLHIQRIWPDCPLDYYQNNIDNLLKTRFRHTASDRINKWLREHMPVGSFFTMLGKFQEQKSLDESKYSFESGLDCHVHSFNDWNDTCSMLARILDNKESFDPPKRWRIAEFHDYVQAESWKITNPNENMAQDLFPEPVRVDYNDQRWSFFQPQDLHQLAAWGQAVRNCVGSATNYAEGVKKKQHFIVLCMVDNVPRFTIQLKVNHGMMSVVQIADVSNQRLTSEQQEDYTAAFGQALTMRNQSII